LTASFKFLVSRLAESPFAQSTTTQVSAQQQGAAPGTVYQPASPGVAVAETEGRPAQQVGRANKLRGSFP
jgi:hypothetical protein